MKKFAIVLSGCGVQDGSEIHESVLCLLAISEAKQSYSCFAPNKMQKKTINHYTRQPEKEPRSSIVEAARIARGDIKPLSELHADDFDAVIFPGGFGAVTTLSSYAEDGTNMQVDPEVERVIIEFHTKKKLIGATCISPILLAKVFSHKKALLLTMGTSKKCMDDMKALGMDPYLCKSDGVVEDPQERIFTTPAYMEDTDIATVFVGIKKMIEKMINRN